MMVRVYLCACVDVLSDKDTINAPTYKVKVKSRRINYVLVTFAILDFISVGWYFSFSLNKGSNCRNKKG